MSSTVAQKIGAKVNRAKQHILDFELAVNAFYETKPYGFSIKQDPQANKRIYYISEIHPVPDNITAIAADVLQNLRSALDHVAFQLVLAAHQGTLPNAKNIKYPISRTASDYQATRKGCIKGVRQEVIDAIDATEPYQRGKGHATNPSFPDLSRGNVKPALDR